MAPTVLEILQRSEARLSGVDSPRLSAEVLVAEALGCSRALMLLERNRAVTPDQEAAIEPLIHRREQGEPVAYILGSKEFYGLDFKVTPDTLIPRPETEHIVELAEKFYSRDSVFRFADLGTGSGILAVTLAHQFPKASGVAVDLSPGALAVAKENALAHSVASRLEFLEGDFTKPLLLPDSFDLIVSNPPYVPEQEYAEASREVTDFEPVTALVSGPDGLDHIRAMLPHVKIALRSGGRFMMEIGYRQAAAIEKLLAAEFPEFCAVEVVKDLSGHDRIISLVIT